MPWIKLDDDFPFNPKVMQAGLHARALYVTALCYAAKGLTDGYVPNSVLRKLGATADIAEPERAAERLAEIGLWEADQDGYWIHDFLAYNPSRDEVLALREVRAEVGRLGGKQRASNLLGNSQANSQANGKQSAKPYPYPSPGDLSREDQAGDLGRGTRTRARARRSGALNRDPDEWLAAQRAKKAAEKARPPARKATPED